MKNREQVSEVVMRLHRYRATDREERLSTTLRRWIEDPLRPTTDKGALRINPVFVLLMLLALLAIGTFLVFSLVQL